MREISCMECDHKQMFIRYGNKSKWDKDLRSMVYYNEDEGQWVKQPEQTCEKCGSTKMNLHIKKVHFDQSSELRDPKHPRYWKNNMSVSDQADVLAGTKNPY